MHHLARRLSQLLAAALLAAIALMVAVGGSPAAAHGFTSVVFADITSPGAGEVRTELGLEYDLLVVSAADAAQDDALFQDGTDAFEGGTPEEQAAALEAHEDTVMAYVTDRFDLSAEGQVCAATLDGGIRIEQREGVPYAVLTLDHACSDTASSHEVRSELFPESEEFVRDTKTIVTYDLDLAEGSAALDADQPTFSTDQSTLERFWEFFKLGAEHLLTGIDHILFLLALIAGSRRLREVVLAATTFTLAHSVTLILAALGLVHAPAAVVEPIIALSIAVVAGWHLWGIWRRGSHATDLETGGGHLSLDRSGWARLAVVFCFGLVHGLGFAGALGIDQAWSWTLLWSLLVFNIGIEAVQLGLIVLLFPVLALLRHRAPVLGLWVTGAIAAGVAGMGLVWFVERIG
ncbi:MAG: HupE/UreJ family protein [Aeromicrobium sp.]